MYAASIDSNGDNSIATRSRSRPIAHKVDEQTVRDYLLGSIVLEFAVILLIVTNAAASTVTREKEDGTLDLLLTTPITSRYYIWGKLRGLVWFVLPLVAVPVASVTVFVLYDMLRFAGIVVGGAVDRVSRKHLPAAADDDHRRPPSRGSWGCR